MFSVIAVCFLQLSEETLLGEADVYNLRAIEIIFLDTFSHFWTHAIKYSLFHSGHFILSSR